MKKALDNRTLKKDISFNPKPLEEDDECFPNGIFHFNVTKILEHIKNNPQQFKPEKLVLKDFEYPFPSVNEDYINQVNNDDPVILAEISPGNFNLIDGNHRFEKARREGREFVMAYRLGPEFHMNYLTTEEAYDKYIEYWNGKIKEFVEYMELDEDGKSRGGPKISKCFCVGKLEAIGKNSDGFIVYSCERCGSTHEEGDD